MKKTQFIIATLLCFLFANAQLTSKKKDSIHTVILNTQDLASVDPKESFLQATSLKAYCKKMKYEEGELRTSMLLTLISYNNGNYKETIEECQSILDLAKKLKNYNHLSDAYRMRGNSYSEMGFVKECLTELKKALAYAEKIDDQITKNYKKALIYESYANSFDKTGDIPKQIDYRQKSIKESLKISEIGTPEINAKYQNLAYQFASLGYVYSNSKQNDSARYYFEEALKIHENPKYNIYANGQATLLSDMAKFYHDTKEYGKSIQFAKRAEKFEKQTSLPYIRKDIYYSLFNSYTETYKIDSSKYYVKLYTALNDSIAKIERESILTPVKQIIEDKETENKNKIANIIIIATIASLALILSAWLLWKIKRKRLLAEYNKLINELKAEKIEAENKNILLKEEFNEPKEKSLNILETTSHAILLRLEKFEKSNRFIKNEVSLTYLANYIGTNTKYLAEILKQHKGKSFSNYINGLRIKYIIKLLYEKPKYREYKISHLAELSGFSSREVFTNVFKKETGLRPSYYINNLKAEKKDL